MADRHPDWTYESERVRRVVEIVRRRENALELFAGNLREQVVQIRQDFWEDVTVNVEDAYEVAETYLSIRQQAELLSERERGHQQAVDQLRTFLRMQESPYFGRIDFRSEGEDEAEPVYLGIGSLRDDSGDHHLVYDWRAPISSLYYDFAPGPVSYEAPGGQVSGTMDVKRQFVIRHGELKSMFDSALTIGDDLLREALGNATSGQLGNIVATIQQTQNRIIRDDKHRMIVVQGAAGSGKTSTALQRIAYLLYRHRQDMTADNIVLFSPNPMFKRYVSTVLPELGEDNMRQTTFQEYLDRRLGKQFYVEDPFEQFEYIHTQQEQPGYSARVLGVAYKSSDQFMQTVDQCIDALSTSGLLFKSIRFRGQTLLSRKEIAERFYALNPDWSIPKRIRQLTTALVNEVQEMVQSQRSESWVEEEMELLETEDYQSIYVKLRRKNQFRQSSFDDHQRERDELAKLVISRHLRPLIQGLKRGRHVDIKGIYRSLFDGVAPSAHLDPALYADMCSQTLAALDENRLMYEDATPYLYLMERIHGFRSNLSVRHVFIDEAQDYTPFQFVFVKRLFPQSRVTALGDANQAIFTHAQTGFSLTWLQGLYGESEVSHMVLSQSYRSTRPIMDFARSMLPNGQEVQPFDRDGPKPKVIHVDEKQNLHQRIVEAVDELHAKGHEQIAIVCKTGQESREAYEWWRGLRPVHLIEPGTAEFPKGILVVPVCLAKGIEFDAVVIYDASSRKYVEPGDLQLLYTACTRAMHELWVLHVGEVSPFLSRIDKALYDVALG